MGLFSNLSGVLGSFGFGGPDGVFVRHLGGKLLVEDSSSVLVQAQGADPLAAQDFVTKTYGDTNYSGSSPATSIGQVLFSLDGTTFTAEQPLTSPGGWLVSSDGILIVVGT